MVLPWTTIKEIQFHTPCICYGDSLQHFFSAFWTITSSSIYLHGTRIITVMLPFSVNPGTMLPANTNLNLPSSDDRAGLSRAYESGIFSERYSASSHVPQRSSSLRRDSAVGLISLALTNTALTGLFHGLDSIAFASEPTHGLESIAFASRYRGPSFSSAIPIPREKEWMFNNYGFMAILPTRIPEQTISKIIVFQPERSIALRFSVSSYPCPKWTPSDLEMIMPDFHGPPKPSPPKGHRWPAFLVPRNFPDEILLRSSIYEDIMVDNLGLDNNGMKRYARQYHHHKKAPAKGKPKCFSL